MQNRSTTQPFPALSPHDDLFLWHRQHRYERGRRTQPQNVAELAVRIMGHHVEEQQREQIGRHHAGRLPEEGLGDFLRPPGDHGGQRVGAAEAHAHHEARERQQVPEAVAGHGGQQGAPL